VPLDIGQKTGSKQARALASQLQDEAFPEAQRHAFTQAAFNRVGETIGDRPVTGDNGVVDQMMKRVGGKFDDLGKRNTMLADADLGNDLVNVEKTYNSHVSPSQRAPIISDRIRDIGSTFPGNGGALPGDVYQGLRSDIRREARRATGHEKDALNDMADALDNAMERSIANNNPSDLGEWGKAREDYQKALVLQDWAGAGEGSMTPHQLAQSSKRFYSKEGYTKGRDPFSDLAEAGKRVILKEPDSWTAQRQTVEKGLSTTGALIGTALGAGGAYSMGHLGNGGEHQELMRFLASEAAGGAAGSFALRPAARALLMNRPVQTYFGNQAIPKEDRGALLARALAQTQGNSNQ
jgi:hypothetical protein